MEFPGVSRYINGNSACQDLFKYLLESDFLPSKLSSILFPLQPSATSLHLCSYLRMLPLEETGLSNIYDDGIIIAFIILSSSLCFGQPSFPPPTSSLVPLFERLLQTSVEPSGGPKLLTAQLVWICPPSQQQERRSKAFAVAGKPQWRSRLGRRGRGT